MSSFDDRRRAESFGTDAEQYDRARPSYPDAVVDELLADGARTVLDVGCGTAKAGRLFAARGCDVVGVDIDERMAVVARRYVPVVEVAAFERWDARGRRFDLAVSAQAWHWIDPVAGAGRLVEVVRPGGRVGLFWNIGRHEAVLGERLETIYAELAPSGTPSGPGQVGEVDRARGPLMATGGFGEAEMRTYPWTLHYSTEEWLDQLSTHSDHRVLGGDDRRRLLDAVAATVDDAGGVTMLYVATLLTARRLG